MKVGLIDVDSKMPNLALMKISAYHKKQNDNVEWYNPMFSDWDKVYMSKIFDFTDDYMYPVKADEIMRGGTGYSLKTKLPAEIEKQCPDYNLYANSGDYALGFTTRGCIRNCPFCLVPEKEGGIKAVADIYDFWTGQDKIKLLDNNLTAHDKHYKRVLRQLIDEEVEVDFSQGLDIRLITPEKARLLSKVKLWKQIHFAFDFPGIEQKVREGIKILKENGVKAYKMMFYVLIGYNTEPEEDLYRVELLRSLGVDPFVMPYDKSDPYQKNFARWVNHKAIFKSVSWDEYRKTS